jgi:hypothetical protein
MPRPLLTLAIPTRNRLRFLGSLLNLLQKYLPENAEVLVVNNNSDDGTEQELVKYCSDPRFRVINYREEVSINGQFERCLMNAKSEWLCVIGDDDGIVPSIFLNMLKLLSQCPSDISAMVWPRVIYRWPGFSLSESNILAIPLTELGALRGTRERSGQLLDKISSNLKAGYYAPGIYHSCLRVDEARRIHEEYPEVLFWGAPDQSCVANLMLEDVAYLRLSKPATVTGYSSASTGGSVTVSDSVAIASTFFSENPGIEQSFRETFTYSNIGWSGPPLLSEINSTYLVYNKVLASRGLAPLPLLGYIRSELSNAHKIPIAQREPAREFLKHLCLRAGVHVKPQVWERYNSAAPPKSLGSRCLEVREVGNATAFLCNVLLSEEIVKTCSDACLLTDSFVSV